MRDFLTRDTTPPPPARGVVLPTGAVRSTNARLGRILEEHGVVAFAQRALAGLVATGPRLAPEPACTVTASLGSEAVVLSVTLRSAPGGGRELAIVELPRCPPR